MQPSVVTRELILVSRPERRRLLLVDLGSPAGSDTNFVAGVYAKEPGAPEHSLGLALSGRQSRTDAEGGAIAKDAGTPEQCRTVRTAMTRRGVLSESP